MKYREKHTLSPSKYESVTYPLAHCFFTRVCIREGGVTDLRDGFSKELCHASAL